MSLFHSLYCRSYHNCRSFVLRHVNVTSQNVARLPSFLRPSKFPKNDDLREQGTAAVHALKDDDMRVS
jgi:hypothetical protein